MIKKFAGVVIIAAFLSACANRGGFTDLAQDRMVFVADTKKMRIARAYIISAGLARVAGSSATAMDERHEIAIRIRSATMAISYAYMCVEGSESKKYNDSAKKSGCAFFDDRIRTVDLALYRIARAVFLPKENQDLISLVYNGLVKEGNPAGKLIEFFDSAGRVVEASATVAKQATDIVHIGAAILQLGRNSFRVGGRLGPIWRDAIELQMQIAIDFLGKYPEYASDLEDLRAVYKNGAGDLDVWEQRVTYIFEKYKSVIEPEPGHFEQITELLVDACSSLVGRSDYLACFPNVGENMKARSATVSFPPGLGTPAVPK